MTSLSLRMPCSPNDGGLQYVLTDAFGEHGFHVVKLTVRLVGFDESGELAAKSLLL